MPTAYGIIDLTAAECVPVIDALEQVAVKADAEGNHVKAYLVRVFKARFQRVRDMTS